MSLTELYHSVRDYSRNEQNAYVANTNTLLPRLLEVFVRTWDLGFTAFGGPPVHFQILYKRFVDGAGLTPWIDDTIYQELFALCQSLPGPASTKLLFCIVFLHAGPVAAVFTFLTWSLPGAIGMFALALGVRNIGNEIPALAYAFLSGLNASTVGLVALAAVQLAEKTIKDNVTRILVIFGACAGLCYTALWYFPALIVIGGIVTSIWDTWLRQQVFKVKARLQRQSSPQATTEEEDPVTSIAISERTPATEESSVHQRRPVQSSQASTQASHSSLEAPHNQTDTRSYAVPVSTGICIIAAFFASFLAILLCRGLISTAPRSFFLFSNMYLAGTIIFGGGPVVIPLLRDYVVGPGWVSPRDFLIGLAIIQAFPGPNFNFAVYLGGLALLSTDIPVLGSLLGYVGIFTPGLVLAVGFQSLWGVMRTKKVVLSFLRGINATAVGLVFTAVYRLWQIGFLTGGEQEGAGRSLGDDPWWVVVATITYAGSCWFKVPAPVAIGFGGLLGLAWYGVVQS